MAGESIVVIGPGPVGLMAVQLAVALTANAAFVGRQITPLTFVCADRDLLTAASNEGLPTVNPNSYP